MCRLLSALASSFLDKYLIERARARLGRIANADGSRVRLAIGADILNPVRRTEPSRRHDVCPAS